MISWLKQKMEHKLFHYLFIFLFIIILFLSDFLCRIIPTQPQSSKNEWTIPTDSGLANFMNLFIDPILHEACCGCVSQFKKKKIVLIDHSHTGQSISSFANLIYKRAGSGSCEVHFLNLISLTQRTWLRPPNIGMVSSNENILLPSHEIAVKIFYDGYTRLLPMNQRWKWEDNKSSLIVDFQKSPRIAEELEKISTFILRNSINNLSVFDGAVKTD